jgi:hypothetical protein
MALIKCQTPGCCCSISGLNVTTVTAQARGWRIYDGPSLTGKPISVCICAFCMTGVNPDEDADL